MCFLFLSMTTREVISAIFPNEQDRAYLVLKLKALMKFPLFFFSSSIEYRDLKIIK